jgi:hypothetical protein
MANRLREGLQLVVQHFPQIAFDYARQFCRHPSQWATLLDELLRVSSPTGNSSISGVYEQIVEYLTGNVDPEAFLNLLPARGHLMYFLPYLCLLFFCAKLFLFPPVRGKGPLTRLDTLRRHFVDTVQKH